MRLLIDESVLTKTRELERNINRAGSEMTLPCEKEVVKYKWIFSLCCLIQYNLNLEFHRDGIAKKGMTPFTVKER